MFSITCRASFVILAISVLPAAFGQGLFTSPQRSSTELILATPTNYLADVRNEVPSLMASADTWRDLGSRTAAHSGGPSLRETLNWLRQQIAAAGVEAVDSESGEPYSFAERFQAEHFDSCTLTIDKIVTRTSEEDPAHNLTFKLRYTLPLGAIAGSAAGHTGNPGADSYISHEKWGYRVFLTSDKKQISRTAFSSAFETIGEEEMTDVFHVIFSSESTAKRVLETFRYAAGLCRDKPPYAEN